MKTNSRKFAVNVLTLAVHGALAAMMVMPLAAQAADENEDVTALTRPTNFVEAGLGNTSGSSAKFGEYNGLNKSGANFIGNFNIRGGSAYVEDAGTLRWQALGTDIGTTSRTLGANVSDQGLWNLGIAYDQLRHNITDSYQTPYQGSLGGNVFTLPVSFGVISTTGAGTRTLTANQQAAYQTQDVHTDRKNTSLSAGYIFDPRWSLKFDFNHLDQSGAKLIGASSDKLGKDPGERIAILMNPTNYQTDSVTLALNWLGEKAHGSVSYYGSAFRDGSNGLSWTSPYSTTGATGSAPSGGAFPVSTQSTPPGNDFHQLNLTGGYFFSQATRMAGGLSYSRNTQNDNYAGSYTPGTVTGLPVSSLNGSVVSTHADLKLTNQATRDLSLSAGVKFNERDNRTASATYKYLDLGGVSRTSVNIPMSNKKTQLELSGDYRITSKNILSAGYEYEQIKRWCNNGLANSAQGATPAYYTTASCVQVPKSDDNKLNLGYRIKETDGLSFNVGYTYDRRKADINPTFYNPMQAVNEGYENYGYVAYFDASRKEHLLKAGVNWQASDQLTFGLSGRAVRDNYDSTLGVQQGRAFSANLDASYSISDNSIVTAYLTLQNRQRDLLSESGRSTTTLLTTQWTNQLTDRDHTVGINARQKGLMGGKLELSQDLTYSMDTTGYATGLNYTLATCTAASNSSCGTLPDVKSERTQFKFTGGYQLDKVSKVILGYAYQHQKSNDYSYNGFQYGYTPSSLIATNQTSPNYTVNTVFAVYNYSFK